MMQINWSNRTQSRVHIYRTLWRNSQELKSTCFGFPKIRKASWVTERKRQETDADAGEMTGKPGKMCKSLRFTKAEGSLFWKSDCLVRQPHKRKGLGPGLLVQGKCSFLQFGHSETSVDSELPFSLSCGRSNRHGSWKEKYQLGTPKTKFSALRRFICPRGTEIREKETGHSGGERRGRKGGYGAGSRGTKDCLWT